MLSSVSCAAARTPWITQQLPRCLKRCKNHGNGVSCAPLLLTPSLAQSLAREWQ